MFNKYILLIGAGRSASTLIKYLLDNSKEQNWQLTVGDISLELARQKTGTHPNACAIAFDSNNEKQRRDAIAKADLVISMLPATMHLPVAKDCLRLKKHLVTASYVSKGMKELDGDAKKAGVLLLNEMGLDPGIDHLSAMKVIDELKSQGMKIITFKSYCGGLVAPESNDNPWGYKFTWNPRAVVMAGQSGDSTGATAQYLENGKIKYVPYARLFTNAETISVNGYGRFESYPNRDSLSYRELYGLQDVKNMLRGTLRMPGFCRAWNAFIQLGLTDDNCKVSDSEKITYAELIDSFLPAPKESLRERKIRSVSRHLMGLQNQPLYPSGFDTSILSANSCSTNIKKKLAKFLHEKENSPVMKKLEWLGIFRNQKIGCLTLGPSPSGEGGNASPVRQNESAQSDGFRIPSERTPSFSGAEILLDLLLKKWSLKPNDKDMVVMQHIFEYQIPRTKFQEPSPKKTAKGKVHRLTSSMVVIGEDQTNTAMSKTVGLPLGIAAKLILNRKINLTGVRIPVVKEIYLPVLNELKSHGISFIEKQF